jgi:hypothetical protein
MRTFHDEMNPSSNASKIALSRSGVKQPAALFHVPVGPPRARSKQNDGMGLRAALAPKGESFLYNFFWVNRIKELLSLEWAGAHEECA